MRETEIAIELNANTRKLHKPAQAVEERWRTAHGIDTKLRGKHQIEAKRKRQPLERPRRERVARVEEALALFPEIAAKRHERAAALSGGQQQILAVAQGLVRRPCLLMLDEPSAGLSPVLVDRVLAVVERLREGGTAVLLVEQLIEKALALADRVYALARGSIVLEAKTGEADLPDRLKHAYLATGA